MTVKYRVNAEKSLDAFETLDQQFISGAANKDISSTKEAFDQLLLLVFGQSGANQIITYYEDDYLTMLVDVGKWFNTVLLPQFQNFGKEQAQKVSRRWRLFH